MTEIPEHLLVRAQKARDDAMIRNPIPVQPTEETVSAKTAVVVPTHVESLGVVLPDLSTSELTRDQHIRAFALQQAQYFYSGESNDPEVICSVVLPIAKAFEEYIRGY